MARQVINLSVANDGFGTALRTGGDMINDMTEELYAFASDTISAGWAEFDAATDEASIQLAGNACISQGKTILHIPARMIPYDGNLVTLPATIRRVREGGNWNTYDARAYGISGWDVGSGRAPPEAINITQSMMAGGMEIIGHRGHEDAAPENTLIGFDAARGLAHSCEMDVQFSSDGVPVVIHDLTVDRTSDLTGNVKDLSIAALEAGDFGSWFGTRFTGTKIPRFREALKRTSEWARLIYAEIKGYRTQADVSLFTQEIVDLGLEDRVVVQSFEPTDYPLVRATSTRVMLGYTVPNLTTFDAQLPLAAADGTSIMIAEYTVLLNNPTRVTTARSSGVDIVAWVPLTTTHLRQLVDIGIRRVMTNQLMHGAIAL